MRTPVWILESGFKGAVRTTSGATWYYNEGERISAEEGIRLGLTVNAKAGAVPAPGAATPGRRQAPPTVSQTGKPSSAKAAPPQTPETPQSQAKAKAKAATANQNPAESLPKPGDLPKTQPPKSLWDPAVAPKSKADADAMIAKVQSNSKSAREQAASAPDAVLEKKAVEAGVGRTGNRFSNLVTGLWQASPFSDMRTIGKIKFLIGATVAVGAVVAMNVLRNRHMDAADESELNDIRDRGKEREGLDSGPEPGQSDAWREQISQKKSKERDSSIIGRLSRNNNYGITGIANPVLPDSTDISSRSASSGNIVADIGSEMTGSDSPKEVRNRVMKGIDPKSIESHIQSPQLQGQKELYFATMALEQALKAAKKESDASYAMSEITGDNSENHKIAVDFAPSVSEEQQRVIAAEKAKVERLIPGLDGLTIRFQTRQLGTFESPNKDERPTLIRNRAPKRSSEDEPVRPGQFEVEVPPNANADDIRRSILIAAENHRTDLAEAAAIFHKDRIGSKRPVAGKALTRQEEEIFSRPAVLAGGIQRMLKDREGFVREDPEYAAFVLQQLRKAPANLPKTGGDF